MKKLLSLLLAATLLCSMLAMFAMPVAADEALTEIEPDAYGDLLIISLNYPEGDYIINKSCTVDNLILADNTDEKYTLTIAAGVTLKVNDNFNNYGTINVLGTLDISSCACIDDIGTVNVFDNGSIIGQLYYEDHPVSPQENTTYPNMIIDDGQAHYITQSCTVNIFSLNNGSTLTIAEGVTVTANMGFTNYDGTLNILGTLDISPYNYSANHATINIGSNGKFIVNNLFDYGKIKISNGGVTVGDIHNTCSHTHTYTKTFCSDCGAEIRNTNTVTVGDIHNTCSHTHTYTKTFCSDCGEEIRNTNTASVLSDGNMTVIVGVGCLALGIVGTLLMTKNKRKPALASGDEKDDEE